MIVAFMLQSGTTFALSFVSAARTKAAAARTAATEIRTRFIFFLLGSGAIGRASAEHRCCGLGDGEDERAFRKAP